MERSCIVFKLEAKDNNLVEANESENKRRCNLEMVDTAWKMTEDNRPKSTTDPPHNYRSEMTLSLTPVFRDTPRGTCENVVYHFHVTIQAIITSYLRPVTP